MYTLSWMLKQLNKFENTIHKIAIDSYAEPSGNLTHIQIYSR